MTDLTKLDEYVLKARVVPVLALLLPVGVVAALLGLGEHPLLLSLTSLGGSGVLALLSADAVRGIGRTLEEHTWASQGGAPSTRAFLGDSPTARDRRARLAKVTGVDVDNEPDSIYRAESALREITFDKRFRRLRIANTDYGRTRHLLALRRYGITTSVICTAIAIYVLAGGPLPGGLAAPETISGLLAVLGCAALIGFWVVVPGRTAYERSANDYADRLLAALDVLASEQA
jgi:hypothetical protein